jgi:hypothetical protein
VISLDTPKKEYLGNFYGDGQLDSQPAFQTYAPAFASVAEGLVIPHAIADLGQHTAYLTLGMRKDTSELACDSVPNWGSNHGRLDYPHATALLVLCDGGGRNAARQYLFKVDLQRLADAIGLEIRIAHDPPDPSPYTPIEQRRFPHLTRACRGAIFTSIQVVKCLIERTHTRQGLAVTGPIIATVYATGRKVAERFKQNLPLLFDHVLPQWNYRAVPNAQVI